MSLVINEVFRWLLCSVQFRTLVKSQSSIAVNVVCETVCPSGWAC